MWRKSILFSLVALLAFSLVFGANVDQMKQMEQALVKYDQGEKLSQAEKVLIAPELAVREISEQARLMQATRSAHTTTNNLRSALAEGFEGTFPPAGWTIINDGDPNGWILSTSGAHTGTNAAKISYGAIAHDDWLVTPELEVVSGDSIILWAKNGSSSWTDEFNVMLSTTGNEKADFTITLASAVATGTVYERLAYDLTPYAGSNVHVAFQAISTDQLSLYIDDVAGPEIYVAPVPPVASTNPAPADEATGVGLAQVLSWGASFGADGYDFNFGTDNPPTNIMNASDLGDVLTYTPAALAYNTTYYWSVTPYNSYGDATGVVVWSFTTRDDPTLVPPFTEDMEIWLPLDWSRYAGYIAADATVLTASTVGFIQDDYLNTVALSKSARVNIYGNTRNAWLMSPEIDLGDGSTTYEVFFDLGQTAYTGTGVTAMGADDRFIFLVSDDGVWDETNALIEWNATSDIIANAGQLVKVNLAGYTGVVQFAFYGESTVSNTDYNVYVDNFGVQEPPVTPVIAISPATLDFGSMPAGGDYTMDVTISNNGGADLVIGGTITDGPFNADYAMTIIPGASDVASIHFSPDAAGIYTGTFEFVVTGEYTGDNTVACSGTAYPASYVTEGFEDGALPYGWEILAVSGQPWVVYNSSFSAHTGTFSVKGPWTSAGAESWLILPELQLTSGDFLNFWMDGSSSAGTDVEVYISTRGNLPTDFTTMLASYVAGVNMPTVYAPISIDLAEYADVNAFVALKLVDANGYSVYVDDFLMPPMAPVETDVLPLLISEIVVTPTGGEFVELYNPNDTPIDLSDFYLTDATYASGGAYYYNITTGANYGGGTAGDFHARFPAGLVMLPGDYLTVAMSGSDAFMTEYGMQPDLELWEDGDGSDAIPDMFEALPGSINGQGGLTNGDEVVIIYYWDGSSDLVSDSDYLLWGPSVPNEAVDKTGITIGSSTYAADTPIAEQAFGPSPGYGYSLGRVDMMEGMEILTDGNGITGHDETSEDLDMTFSIGLPSPGAAFRMADFNEPNDILATATTVLNGDSLVGLIDPTDDLDFFTFTVTETVEVSVHMYINGFSNLDGEIRLFDEDSVSLASADVGASGGDESLSSVLLPGTYYLVAGYWLDVLRAEVGAYALTFNWEPYVIMPGETCEDPLLYQYVNDEPQTGAIESYGAVWYSFEVTGDPSSVTVSLCGSDFDTKVEVWAACDAETYMIYNDDACGPQSQVDLADVPAGVYFVKVYGYSAAFGNYVLSVTGGQPGSTCDLALDAVIGENAGSGSNEWFAYTAATDGVVKVSSQNETGDALWDTYLFVYDGCGEEATLIAENDDCCGYYGPSTAEFLGSAGMTYYILWDDSWAPGPFTWIIDEMPVAPRGLMADGHDGFIDLNWMPPAGAVMGRTASLSTAAASSDNQAIDKYTTMSLAKKQTNPTSISDLTLSQKLNMTPRSRHLAITTPRAYQATGLRTSDVTISLTVDDWFGEASWNVWDYTTSSYYYLEDQVFTAAGENQTVVLALDDGDFSVDVFDSYGDGGISGMVLTADETVITFWGATDYANFGEYAFTILTGAVYGCMDSEADNYNPAATLDNGTCIYLCDDGIVPDGVVELEENDGLNADPIQYDPRACGDLITGTYMADGVGRDTDWYNFTLAGYATVEAWVDVTCGNPQIYILDAGATAALGIGNANGDGMGETLMTPLLPPGDYWFWVGSQVFEGDGEYYNYNAGFTCTPQEPTSYTVYRGGVEIATDLLDNRYTDGDVSNGTEYCYTVTATTDEVETVPSNEACATPSVFFPEPMALMAVGFDTEVDLAWTAPFPMGQLSVDDGTAENWYYLGWPLSTDQMFALKLTPPSDGNITHVALWSAADEPAPWNAVYVTGSTEAGTPDLLSPYEVFMDVLVETSIGEGGQWNVLQLTTPAPVIAGQDLFVVAQYPVDPADLQVGPFIASDADNNLGRNYGTTNGGTSWFNGTGTYIMRAYMQPASAPRENIEITAVPRDVRSSLPVISLADHKEHRGKRENISFSLSAPGLQSNALRDLSGYYVHRGTEPGVYSFVSEMVTETLYVDEAVSNGTAYFYAVTAVYDGVNQSGFSNEVMALPQGPGTVPYANNFDETAGGFFGTGDWQWGAPSDPPGASSAPNVWGTVLNGIYTDARVSFLELAFDLSGSEYGYELTFNHSQDIEENWDYGYVAVDYDSDGFYDVLSVHTGVADWMPESVIIPPMFTSAYTKVAFIFEADGNTNGNGWYIDDVTLNPFVPAIMTVTPDQIVAALEAPATSTQDLVIGNVGGLDLLYGGIIEYIDGTSVDSVLFESFDAGLAGWTLVDNLNDGATWVGESNYLSIYNIDGTPFAFVNSDAAGSVAMDEELISPAVDTDGALSLTLEWDQFFNAYSGNETGDVDVWNGLEWVNVFSSSADVGSWATPDHQMIDITGLANDELKVRFHYYNADWDFYWAVDNVLITVEDGVPWVTVDGGFTFGGEIVMGASDRTHLISLNSEGLTEGTYHANIWIAGNGGETVVPVELTVSVVSTDNNQLPDVYALAQNYPNPFNPVTSIQYQLPEAADVRIIVYNVLGQKVATLVDQHRNAGFYSVMWAGTDNLGNAVSSGVYLYRIETKNFTDVKKLMLLK
mgnify:FL=1